MGHDGSSGESLDYVHHFSEGILLLGLFLTVLFAENYNRFTQIFKIIGLSPPRAHLALCETLCSLPANFCDHELPPIPLDMAWLLS